MTDWKPLTMWVTDTSVVVASIVHGDAIIRGQCRDAIERSPTALSHVIAESYARLTSMPGNVRLAPQTTWHVLRDMFPHEPLALSASGLNEVMHKVADLGIAGGAIYDCLIAQAAKEHSATLVSLDRRAAKNYTLIGVAFELL